MGTRYYWQAARLEGNRARAWEWWAEDWWRFLELGKALPLGMSIPPRPEFKLGPRVLPAEWGEYHYDVLAAARLVRGRWGLDYQRQGHSYAETVREMSVRFEMSETMARREMAEAERNVVISES